MKDSQISKWLWLTPLLVFAFYGLRSYFQLGTVEIAVFDSISEEELVRMLDRAIQVHPFAAEIDIKYTHLSTNTGWLTAGHLRYSRKTNGLDTTNGYFSFVTPDEVHQSARQGDSLLGLARHGEGLMD